MNVLVAGGAGYIGSHAVKALIEAGHAVVVIDNLYRGHAEAVDSRAHFDACDLLEGDRIAALLREHKIEAVMHFAALAYVGESVSEPLRYYENNTTGTLRLLQACAEAGVKKFVFSSTCATYGEPSEMPIRETTPQHPVNAYGWSKLICEKMLLDQQRADPEFGFIAFRYFNVCGAARDGSLGEDHTPESHIIPLLLLTALGQREQFTIFGTDYPTPDGTCIRDYVHVEDLVAAHILGLERIRPGDPQFYNLGIGRGYSVREIIDAAVRVTGIDLPVVLGERRPGDPPELYANADRIRDDLGWEARQTDIDEIIASAWRWFQAHPNGYQD